MMKPRKISRSKDGLGTTWLISWRHLTNAGMIESTFLLTLLMLTQVPSNSTLAVPTMSYELQTVNACLNQPNKTLPLFCPHDHMVLLKQAYFGHSPSSHCFPEDHHCKHLMADPVTCVGRETCFINMPSGGEGRPLPACNEKANYIHAEYMCVPDSSTIDICSETKLVSNSIFLSTPKYPYNYPTNTECSLRLEAPFSQQRIKVFIIDLSLENSQTDCADWLHLFDGHRSETYCNIRSMMPAMETFQHWISLTFHSNEANPWKGFWIYVEVYPFIETTTLMSTTLPLTTTEIPTTQTTLVDTSTTIKEKSTTMQSQESGAGQTIITHKDNDSLLIGVVVGTILAILLCIVVVLLVVVLLRRPNSHMCLLGALPYQTRGTSASVVALNNQPIYAHPVTYVNNDCAQQHIDYNLKTGEEQIYC